MSEPTPETPATPDPTSAAANPPAADASSAPAAPATEAAAPSSAKARAIGSTVEFQTFDPITGEHLRGFGIVRGLQDDDANPGSLLTQVTPLPVGVLLLSDDEILDGG